MTLSPCRIILMLVSIVAATVVAPASASSGWSRQAAEMNELQTAAFVYKRDTGAFPVTDQANSWYEKLVANGYLSTTAVRFTVRTANGVEPADLYGFPMIYRIPDDPAALEVFIRCVGENGIDDGGVLDDWDIGTEPNFGYWYKWNWPQLYRRAWQCAVGLAVIVSVIAWRIRPRLLATACAFIVIGLTGAIIMPLGFDAGLARSSASHIPRWVDSAALIGAFTFLAGLAMAGGAVAQVRRRRRSAAAGCCPDCRYDLRGDLATGCPECGWGRGEAGDDGVSG